MEEGRSAFRIVTLHLQERDLLEGLGVDESTLLEWILKKRVSIRGIGFILLRIGSPCECDNEPTGFISYGVS